MFIMIPQIQCAMCKCHAANACVTAPQVQRSSSRSGRRCRHATPSRVTPLDHATGRSSDEHDSSSTSRHHRILGSTQISSGSSKASYPAPTPRVTAWPRAVCTLALALLFGSTISLTDPPAAAAVQQLEEEEETLSNIPGQLDSSREDTQRQPLSRLMQGSNKRAIEACTRKCVPTCVRGGEGTHTSWAGQAGILLMVKNSPRKVLLMAVMLWHGVAVPAEGSRTCSFQSNQHPD